MRLDLETGTKLYALAVRLPATAGRTAAELLSESCRLQADVRESGSVASYVDCGLAFTFALFRRRSEAMRAYYALGGKGWDVAVQVTKWIVAGHGLPVMD